MKLLKICLISLLFVSCSTVQTIRPKTVRSTAPSVDASTPKEYKSNTSGVISLTRDKDGLVVNAVITPDAKNYYNFLVTKYGNQISPPLKVGDGLGDTKDVYGNYLYTIDTPHLVYFQQMSLWNKSNRPLK